MGSGAKDVYGCMLDNPQHTVGHRTAPHAHTPKTPTTAPQQQQWFRYRGRYTSISEWNVTNDDDHTSSALASRSSAIAVFLTLLHAHRFSAGDLLQVPLIAAGTNNSTKIVGSGRHTRQQQQRKKKNTQAKQDSHCVRQWIGQPELCQPYGYGCVRCVPFHALPTAQTECVCLFILSSVRCLSATRQEIKLAQPKKTRQPHKNNLIVWTIVAREKSKSKKKKKVKKGIESSVYGGWWLAVDSVASA